MAKPFGMGHGVYPICLASVDKFQENLTNLLLTKFDSKTGDKKKKRNQLSVHKLDQTDEESCRKNFPKLNRKEEFCVKGTSNMVLKKRDSGSPVAVANGDRITMVGLITNELSVNNQIKNEVALVEKINSKQTYDWIMYTTKGSNWCKEDITLG